MLNKPVLLLDLNILMDVVQQRSPFYTLSANIMDLAERGHVAGMVASHSITTLFYLYEKFHSSAEAKARITNLLQFLKIVSVDQNTIEQALNLEYQDFEDAVQMICAMQCKADYLITRNIKDFKPMLLPVLQPAEFLLVYSQNKSINQS